MRAWHGGKPVLVLRLEHQTLQDRKYVPPTILCIILHGLQLTVLTLELHSPSLPTPLVFNMNDTAKMADIKKNPITIKEGVDYMCVC